MPRITDLGLGVIAATAAVALAPSAANAATCTVDPNLQRNFRAQMTTNQIVVQNFNGQVIVGEPGGTGTLCALRSSMDKLTIRSANAPGFDRVTVDESLGSFTGLKIFALTGSGNDNIVVNGSPGNDRYAAIGALGASIDMGGDFNAELISTLVGTITINGNGGADEIGGPVGTFPLPTQRLEVFGGLGRDNLVAGGSGKDLLNGGADPDRVFANNGKAGDRAIGGDGPGDFVFADTGDIVSGFEGGGIGGAKPRSIRAHRGKTSTVRLSWAHPVNWKQLGSVTLSAYDGRKKVGTVRLAPRTGRITARGGVKVVGHGPVRHKGKKVSVSLKLKFAGRLDGEKLDLRMQAKDR